MINLSDLFSTYQSNVTEGMIQQLADELNVSTDAIKALGVGFWPSKQAWIFAERNAKGEIIGLTTRYIHGGKAMVEGSSHGLTYILNPKFRSSKLRGGSLLQDFVGVKKAKVKCPICGRPDWCLVSRDDPEHPAEVICPRPEYKEGSIRQMGGAGWLHVLDKDRARSNSYQKGSGPLLPSDKPYLVVEGASDVLAAYDIGFVGIGKPNNISGHGLLGTLIKGKQVVILGENDKKVDDSWPGKAGMEITFDKIHGLCDAVMVMPPTGVKDLRVWLECGVTDDELLEYINANASIKVEDNINVKIERKNKRHKTDDKNLLVGPATNEISVQWVKEKHTDGIYILLRHFRGKWWDLAGSSVYKPIAFNALEQEVQAWLEGKEYIEIKETKKGTTTTRKKYDWDCNTAQKVIHTSFGLTQINNDEKINGAFIIKGSKIKSDFDPFNQIVLENGVLNIETNELVSMTPDLFRTSVLPFDYNPDATCPLWLKSLHEWFSDGEDSIQLLQQWFGYNLLACDKRQKVMFLWGSPGSGKGTVMATLKGLLGEDKCCSPGLDDLKNTHGKAGLLDKHAIMLSEDKISNNKSGGHALTLIKKLTGQDDVWINIKNGPIFSTKLFGRLTYQCNSLPTFSDNEGALRRRVIILRFDNCFEKDEKDPTTNYNLRSQLAKELPGILNWAIKGLHDLEKANRFATPEASDAAKRELRFETSSIADMGACCLCFDDPDAFTSTKMLFNLHLAWFRQNKKAIFNERTFGKEIAKGFPDLKKCRPGIHGEQVWGYQGVSILPEAIEQHLDGPSG